MLGRLRTKAGIGLLGLVSACGVGGAEPQLVEADSQLSSADGAVSAVLSMQSSWSGGYCANVVVSNTGSQTTTWTVGIKLNGTKVSNSWNGQFAANGDDVKVTGSGWNASLPARGSTNFGFCGTSSSSSAAPTVTSMTHSASGNGSTGGGGSTNPTTGTGGAGSGTPSTGGPGGSGTGGSPSGGGITSSCTEGQKSLTSNATGTHCGYTYEYWKDSGNGTLLLKSDGFSVDWSNIGNLLGRKGLRPGSKSNVVTYEANYQPSGNSYLTVYGWTKSPLVEYYIVDSWGSWRPPGGEGLQGTVTCDGATYDIYKTQRVNQPSIEGNTTFYQFWSVRQQKRTSGNITVGCHFDAWAKKGMTMGSLYEVSMTVEGYQSSGKADVKMSIK